MKVYTKLMGLKALILDIDHSVMVLSISDITAAAWLLLVTVNVACSDCKEKKKGGNVGNKMGKKDRDEVLDEGECVH